MDKVLPEASYSSKYAVFPISHSNKHRLHALFDYLRADSGGLIFVWCKSLVLNYNIKKPHCVSLVEIYILSHPHKLQLIF